MTLTKLLFIPLVLTLAFLLYQIYALEELSYSKYVIWPILAGVSLYFIQPAIDWKWYHWFPPSVTSTMKKQLNEQWPFYSGLDASEKKRFSTRLALFLEAREFIPKSLDSVPYDIKAWIGTCAVTLTFGWDQYLMQNFERIVVYKADFPSPQFKESLHASEIELEDGVVLLALDRFYAGMQNYQKYFNIGLYEFAKICLINNPYDIEIEDERLWSIIKINSGSGRGDYEKFLGLKINDPLPILISQLFTHWNAFKTNEPDILEKIASWLNINLANPKFPCKVKIRTEEGRP